MRRFPAVAVLVLVGVLTGCSGSVPFVAAAPRPDAVPVDAVPCGDESMMPAEGIIAGNVPDDFTPVAVQRCTFSASLADDVGTWSGSRSERLEGDLAELLAALAEPDEAPTMWACTADMWIGPELWLADPAGRYIRVSYPMGACPKPREDVLERIETALASLAVTDETFVRRALVESDAATAAGCPTTAGMLVAVSGDMLGTGIAPDESVVGDGSAPSIPWEAPRLPDAADIGGMRLCRYAVGVPSSAGGDLELRDTGTFSSAGELDATKARAILDLFASAPRADGCDAAASSLIVARPAGAGTEYGSVGLTVEMDGCQRMVGPDLTARAAPEALRALLEP